MARAEARGPAAVHHVATLPGRAASTDVPIDGPDTCRVKTPSRSTLPRAGGGAGRARGMWEQGGGSARAGRARRGWEMGGEARRTEEGRRKRGGEGGGGRGGGERVKALAPARRVQLGSVARARFGPVRWARLLPRPPRTPGSLSPHSPLPSPLSSLPLCSREGVTPARGGCRAFRRVVRRATVRSARGDRARARSRVPCFVLVSAAILQRIERPPGVGALVCDLARRGPDPPGEPSRRTASGLPGRGVHLPEAGQPSGSDQRVGSRRRARRTSFPLVATFGQAPPPRAPASPVRS